MSSFYFLCWHYWICFFSNQCWISLAWTVGVHLLAILDWLVDARPKGPGRAQRGPAMNAALCKSYSMPSHIFLGFSNLNFTNAYMSYIWVMFTRRNKTFQYALHSFTETMKMSQKCPQINPAIYLWKVWFGKEGSLTIQICLHCLHITIWHLFALLWSFKD